MNKPLTEGKKEALRRGQRKFYQNNKETVSRSVLISRLKQSANSKPQTLDKHNIKISDFTQNERMFLNEKVLAHLLIKEFKSKEETIDQKFPNQCN